MNTGPRLNTTMDSQPKTERKKKKDKAQEKFERNGKHSQKHIRAVEALAERRAVKPKN